jgi:hypothetical protein
MEKAPREEKKRGMKMEVHRATHAKEVWVNQGSKGPHPNQWHIKTKVPSVQFKQVEDDKAFLTAEYFPAKASHEEYG